MFIVAVAGGVAVGRATANPGSRPAAEPLATSPSIASFTGDEHRPESRGHERHTAASTALVYVAGAVAKPGVYRLGQTARADDALRAAGGATASADLVSVNLAGHIEDGEEIAVPVRGSAEDRAGDGVRRARIPRRHSAKRGRHRKSHRRAPTDTFDTSDSSDAPSETVDINAADEATLQTLPGVGASLAQRIVAFRDLNGPFASSDELLDVGGMTPGKVDALAPYVVFR